MSEGRRVTGAPGRRKTSSSGEDRSPFVLRSAPRRAFDYVRSRTTSSPARFAVAVFVTLILLFTALLSLPAATNAGQRLPLADALFTAVSTICVTGLTTVDIATTFSPLRQGHHLHRREHRRYGRAHARVDPGPGDLQAPGPARQAHRRERHESRCARTAGRSTKGQTVRLGEVGVLLRTVALSTLVIEGVIALMLYPLAADRRASAPSRRCGKRPSTPRWPSPTPASRRTSGGLVPFADDYVAADRADDRRLPRLDRLPGDLHAVEALLARAPLDAARQAHAHHHRRCCSSPARARSWLSSSTTPRRSDR